MTETTPWYERYRVRLSFFFAAIFLIYARPKSLHLLIAGGMIAAFGIFLRQWAAGHIQKMDEVSRAGPYAIVRHPLYVGSFLGAVGMLIASAPLPTSVLSYQIQTLFIWSLFTLLVRTIYIPKAKREEENLINKFGKDYIEYAKETPPFIPKKLSGIRNFRLTFRWDLWLRNQEFMSLIGFVLIVFLLVSRYHHR